MRRLSLLRLMLVTLGATALAACGDDDSMPIDGGSDSGPARMCDDIAPFETGDDQGHANPLGAGPGEARAGRIQASELPADPNGLAVWAPNDFVLANERVAVLIEDVGTSDLYDPYGGRIDGLARREADTLIPADFNEILFGIGAFLVATETVTVIADGSDGGSAIVRATGPLREIDFAGDLLSSVVRGDFGGWPAAIDYELAPDSDRMTITVHLNESAGRAVRVPFLLQGFFQISRMPLWTPGTGFAAFDGEVPYLAFDDRRPGGVAYVWEPPADRALQQLIEQAGVLVTQSGSLSVGACERLSVPIGSIVVGRTLDGAQATLRAEAGEASRTVTGKVLEADGTPATDVRVHVTATDGTHLTRGGVDENGAFTLSVPDEDVQVWAYRRGTPIAGPAAAPRGTADVALEMAPMGTITVSARDSATGAALPARVAILPIDTPITRPDGSWGEPQVSPGRANVYFAGASGEVSARVPVGEWRVLVSRGYEYELSEHTPVTVGAGATVALTADLQRSVDTTGVLCADYHIHTTRSPDADDDADEKLAALVADGLEIAVRSDHEFVADFGPVVEELGLGAFVLGLGGEELTTFEWGHFGVFPLQPDHSRPNGGAPRWPGRLPTDVFDEARAMPGSPTIIVNHPRSGGMFGGYFHAAMYDPATGMVGRMDLWDENFSVVEVLNDSSFDENRDGTVRDWLSLLRFGRRVFAVGSSDSHHLHSAPVGYPRTCLEIGSDDPSAVTPEQVRDATAEGRSYVSGGIYLEVVGPDGVRPGGEATGVGAMAMIDVVVRAASWIDVDRLEVLVDGETVQMIDILDSADAVRFDQTITVPVAPSGSFVIVVASGDEELEPVHRGRLPFAMSNPIFLRR